MTRTQPGKTGRGRFREVLRGGLRWGIIILILATVAFLVWARGALHNRFVRFPREGAAWAAIRAQRQAVTNNAGWNEYRGILHSHSELSHDCEVAFPEILSALKSAGLDFICLSDHCTAGRADFDLQWRGIHDGKLFIPGFEMKDGIMPFGVAPGIVLSNQMESAVLVRQIQEHGGLFFYAHPEETRVWDRPELMGMEIYNLHSEFKMHRDGLRSLVPDLLLNQRRYPDHVLRLMFHRPEAFLKRWDDLNRTRHITGIAGNDCHQNTGVRGIIVATNTLHIDNTGRRTLLDLPLNWFTRPLARLCFGRLDPDRELFRVQLDPYERLARFVNTHVLSRELSEPAILEALQAGRAFVGFDLIADSTGFRWFATNSTQQAVMGESLALTSDTRFMALSPHLCRFTVFKNGEKFWQQQGWSLQWPPNGPGKYRVEAELRVMDEWVPWVYANPIEIRGER